MRREEVLRNHWFFSQEVGKEEALASDFQRGNWQAIQVPHDWSIYNDFDQYSPAQNEGGQLNGGAGLVPDAVLLGRRCQSCIGAFVV